MNHCLNCGNLVKNKYCDVSCQNKHQNAGKIEKKFGTFKKYLVLCNNCESEFEVVEREKLHPVKDKYYCSRSCANSRSHSDETRQKIKNSLCSKPKKEKEKYSCLNCGEIIESRKIRIFCSKSCATNYRNLYTDQAKNGGRKSVISQNRRSKNEIFFSELCLENFDDVKLNEQIFNGWDADVILIKYKLAIMWNGIWHYKKIGEKHSLLQVQNRDNIKIHEIIKCGYVPYIIKDLGKYNKEFVKTEFEKLKIYLKYIAE